MDDKKNYSLFFPNCCFMHMYVCVCLYLHSHKSHSLGLYKAICMCVLRLISLVLGKQLVCFSLGKSLSTTPSIPSSCGSLCRAEPCHVLVQHVCRQ